MRGIQTPRIRHDPVGAVGNAAPEAIALCASIGMPLDEWQQIALTVMLGEAPDGTWSAQEYALIVARQNGKNAVIEARELAGLFLFDEPLIVHSAHHARTAKEAFVRLRDLISSVPWLLEQVDRFYAAPGGQEIRLKSGQRLMYMTRTKGGARGISAPVLIVDEAQELTGEQFAGLKPIVRSFPEKQTIYTGTVLGGANVFHGFVQRGRDDQGDRFGYTEWSAHPDADSADVQAMLQANPAIGFRLDIASMVAEEQSFRAAGEEQRYREEYLSIWPATDAIGTLFSVSDWAARLADDWAPGLRVPKPYSLAIAITPGRKRASIGFACYRPDGRSYVELLARSGSEITPGSGRFFPAGIDWVLPWIDERLGEHAGIEWVIDQRGPAAALQPDLARMGVPVRMTTTSEFQTACIGTVDAVVAGRLAHRGQEELTVSAHAVQRRDVGESWVYDRRASEADAIEAVSLARWGLSPDPSKKAPFGVLDWNAIYADEENL